MNQTVNKLVLRVFTATQGKTESLVAFSARRIKTAVDTVFYTQDVTKKGRTVHETPRDAMKRIAADLECGFDIISIEERTFAISY